MPMPLRPEARPFALENLTHFQREAVKKILESLKVSANDLSKFPKREDSSGSSFDRKRSSRIFFLSGEPGTGKTTAYLAIRNAFSQSGKPGPCKDDEDLEGIIKLLGDLKDRVVWLESLDLEVAASSTTNYLAAVIARIDQALRSRLGTAPDLGRSTPGHSAGLLEKTEGRDVLSEFQRLKADIGLAWDGNLRRRAETLDPDVFAEEVMRAEEIRLNIDETLKGLLDKLAKRFWRNRPNLIFVLPVDDLSSDPKASLEFLRLMRMISSPRLFILAMGEIEILEELFFQKTLGDLLEIGGRSRLALNRQERVLVPRARRIAFHSLRKLLPSSQQVNLQVLYWNEALDISLSKLDVDTNGSSHDAGKFTLRHLLELIPLSLDYTLPIEKDENPTLMDFLRLPGNPGIHETRLEREGEPKWSPKASGYTGLQILEVPHRNALDLWLNLYKLLRLQDREYSWRLRSKELWPSDSSADSSEQLMALVVDQVIQNLNEQDVLDNEPASCIEKALDRA